MKMRIGRSGTVVALLAATCVVGSGSAAHGDPAGSATSAATSLAPWKNIGPPGGYVESVAVDPSSPSTIYAGLNGGGVFKSTTSGSSWASSGLPGTEIRALAVDPSNDTVVYALNPGGLFTSTNGGASWTFNSALGNVQVDNLAVDPTNGSVLYVASQNAGIYKSTDGGTTWTTIDTGLSSAQVNQVVVAPSDPSTLYAATPSGVFVSGDSGATWSSADTGLTNTNIQSVAVDPAHATSAWAITVPGFFAGSAAFRSTDGGANWSADSAGLPGPPSTLYGLLNVPLLVTSTTVYAGLVGFGVYAQPISGSTWTAAHSGMKDPNGQPTQYPFTLVADPANESNLFAGTQDGGIFVTTNGAVSWAAANRGLLGNTIVAMAGLPSNENQIYAATQSLGLFVSSNGGASWKPAHGVGAVNAIEVDPTTPSTVWAGGAGIFETTDNGLHWNSTLPGQAGLPITTDVTGIAVDPFNSAIVYAALLGDGIYETTDGGASWTAANNGLTNLEVSTIAADPATAGLLYAGTFGSGVFTSTDGATSWTQMPTTGLASLTILSLVDGNPEVTTTAGVFWYASSGGKWLNAKLTLENRTTVTGTDCHQDIKTVPNQPLLISHWWVLCNEGLFNSFDSGKTFFQLSVKTAPGYQGLVQRIGGDPLLLIGTLGDDILALPSKVPIFTKSAASKSSTGSATATVPRQLAPSVIGSLSATASNGTGKVTSNDYFGNPTTVQTSFAATEFFGLSLSSTNTFQSVTIQDCQLTDGNTSVEWLNGSTWQLASNQAYEPTSGCVQVTIDSTTSPNLANLANAYFANTGY